MANRNGSIETAVISTLLGACLILGGCGGGGSAAETDKPASAEAPDSPQARMAITPTSIAGNSTTVASAASAAVSATPAATAASGSSVPDSSSAATATPANPVQDEHIIATLDPSRPFAEQEWKWTSECGGQTVAALNLPETGTHFTDLGDEFGSLRFGKWADPDAPSRSVLVFRANASDPLIYGAPRCEASTSPTAGGAIPVGVPIWFSFGVRLPAWTNTSDEQSIAQWHQSHGSIPMNPFFAILIKGGDILIKLRYNQNDPVSKDTTTTILVAQQANLPVDNWTYFTIKALISHDAAKNPYLKVWRDGAALVDYRGAFGYNAPATKPFLKVGHYHWIDASNPWSNQAATRTVLIRTPTLVLDAGNQYRESDIRQHVSGR